MLEPLQVAWPSGFPMGLPGKRIRVRHGLFALLAAVGSIFVCFLSAGFCAVSSPAQRQELAAASSPTSEVGRRLFQTAAPEHKGEENSTASRSAIQTVLEHVATPDLQTLAKALGIANSQTGTEALGASQVGKKVIGDLDGDGVPEAAVSWKPPDQSGNGKSLFGPSLYLLSWDGKEWQASPLMKVVNAFELEILPGSQGPARLIAVVVFQGITAVPYPMIFAFRDHKARMLWDGRSDSSLYTGYDYGVVQFKKPAGGGFPEMIASGRADPGLLVFPKQPEPNGRGFQKTSIYVWKNDAYVPVRTEYTPSKDYSIYRFIAALHLHEFGAAYALIDPKQFLKTEKPSLKLYREHMEKERPEFLDDRIFQVPATHQEPGGHDFTLALKNGKTYLYHPTFTAGPAHLLGGLQRKEINN